MKLLKKTNSTYLLISGSAFIIAGAVTYFVLSYLFKEQLDEKLMSNIEYSKSTIARDGILPDYFPFIETREVQGQSERSYEKKDTLIFDAVEEGNIDFRQISLVCSINGKMYFIAGRNELFENSDLLMTIVFVISSVFILLLISLYIINKRLFLNIWKPFYHTLDELKEFSYDKPGFRLSSVSRIDEFAELNQTLKKLTSKAISDYQSLKRFTEDASHEIQTPLAIIQLKLEALLQYPGLNREMAEIINSAYGSTLRISKLTQTLLLLTKIDNNQFPEKQRVNLSELIEEKIRLFEDHINGKALILHKSIESECFLETNIFLTESMIMNLLGNAFKYCSEKGVVSVSLKSDQLIMSNTGAPLSVPPSKLFERFYKENMSSETPGLGLSIVKKICEVNNWQVEYVVNHEIHIITIRF
jgi:signal transduction histidine kinase